MNPLMTHRLAEFIIKHISISKDEMAKMKETNGGRKGKENSQRHKSRWGWWIRSVPWRVGRQRRRGGKPGPSPSWKKAQRCGPSPSRCRHLWGHIPRRPPCPLSRTCDALRSTRSQEQPWRWHHLLLPISLSLPFPSNSTRIVGTTTLCVVCCWNRCDWKLFALAWARLQVGLHRGLGWAICMPWSVVTVGPSRQFLHSRPSWDPTWAEKGPYLDTLTKHHCWPKKIYIRHH